MTLVAICVAIPQRMRLSSTVVEIWRLKDNGVTTLIGGQNVAMFRQTLQISSRVFEILTVPLHVHKIKFFNLKFCTFR